MAKTSFFKDFRNFIERGNAIDMAVGIIVGSVMTSVVNSLVTDVIMPPIGLLIGGVDFSQLFAVIAGGNGMHFNTVAEAQAAGATTINYGLFLNSVVSFLITMFAVFLIVRTVGKMRSKQAVTTRACPYCTSTISVSATKCPFCCSAVKAVEATPAQESDLAKGLNNLKSGITKKIKKMTK